MDLTDLSSLRACRTFKTVVKRKFFTSPIDPFVTSCVSDAQNCGKMQVHQLSGVTFSSLRTCWTLKTVVKCKFFTCPSDLFVTLDVSDVQNCGKMHNSASAGGNPFVTSCVSDDQNCGKMGILVTSCVADVENWCFWCWWWWWWWCFCGGVVVFSWWCGGVFVAVL